MNACSAGSVFRRVQSPIKALAFRRGWFTFSDGRKLFVGPSGTSAPLDGADPRQPKRR